MKRRVLFTPARARESLSPFALQSPPISANPALPKHYNHHSFARFTDHCSLCMRDKQHFFVARLHAVHAERDIVMENPSVCPSVQCWYFV